VSDVTRLRDTVDRFSAFILALPVDTLASQSTDGASGEWGPREVLAHLVYHHELYIALVEASVAGTIVHPPAGTFRELNAQAVAANAGIPTAALVARLQEANRRLERLYLAHDPHTIVVEIKAGAKPRTLAALVPEVEAHIRNHLRKLQHIVVG
jgi:hypothetical protein